MTNRKSTISFPMSLLRGGGAENAGPENEGPSVIVSGHENVCK